MQDIPDVSVIVPAFNRVHVLHRSLASILSQRGLQVELIVVDDCSIDDTWQHLERLRDDNPAAQIRLLRLERNAAQATARNRGLELARAAHIAFLDTDDALADHDILADMLAQARADRLDMLIAPFLYFDGASLTPHSRLEIGTTVTDAQASPGLVDSRSHWHVLYARAFLDRVPLRFAEVIRHREDRPFLTGALLNARRIGAFARPMVHYFRDMADSVMNNPTLREFGFYLEHLREVNRWLDLARDEGRLNPEFARLNAVLYGCSHLHYWAGAWLQLTADHSPGMAQMLVDFDSELDRLFRPTGLLYPLDEVWPDHPIIRDAGRDLVSGRIDLFRHAILNRDHGLIRALLSGPDLPLSWLYRVKGRGDEAERIAQRALAFAGRREGIAGRIGRDHPPGALVGRILLHVGGMKTGSSALQNWLEQNRFALLDQGVLYPATGTWREDGVRSPRNSGHDALIQGLLRADQAPAMRRALMAEIAALPQPPKVLILSLETIVAPNLYRLGYDFADIARAIGGRIELCWLEREAGPWLRSIHREQICNPRNGYTGSLAALEEEFRTLGLLDRDRVTAMLTAPPEVIRLHHANDEHVRLNGGTLDWFARIAGIAMQDLAAIDDSAANRSFSDEQAAQILALKSDPALTPLQRDEGFRLIARGERPDPGEIAARFPQIRPIPGRLERMAALNRMPRPAAGIGAYLLPPDLHLLMLPAGTSSVRVVAADGRAHLPKVLNWEGCPIALLDSRLVGRLGPACRVEMQGEPGQPHSIRTVDFTIRAAPDLGMLRLAQRGEATTAPHLLWRQRGGTQAKGLAEAVVLGLPDDTAARDWLLQQPAFASAGRMSPWRAEAQLADLRPIGGAAADWRDYLDPAFYLGNNPDLATAGVDPYAHFKSSGEAEGRLPVAGLPRHFLGSGPDQPGFAAHIAAGQRWLLPGGAAPPPTPPAQAKPPASPAALVEAAIDPTFYAAARHGQKPATAMAEDTKNARMDARASARHYLTQGHAQGLDPAPWFSESGYLRDHPDVAQAGIPAFQHYLTHGVHEGRRIRPSARNTGAGHPVPADLLRLQPRLTAAFSGRQARLLLLGAADHFPAVLPDDVVALDPADTGLLPRDCPPEGLAAILRAIAGLTGARVILGIGGPCFSSALQGGLVRRPEGQAELAVEGWFPADPPLADLPLVMQLRRIHLPPGRFEEAFANWSPDLPPLRAGDLPDAIASAGQAIPQP